MGTQQTADDVRSFISNALGGNYKVLARTDVAGEDFTADGKRVFLYKFNNNMTDEQIVNALVTGIDAGMAGMPVKDGANDIDYFLTIEKAEIGVAGNGATVIAIMFETKVTKN